MYNHRGKLAYKYPSQDSYACVQYSQYPPKCTCHHISTENLRAITLEAIRSVSAYVKANEAEFLRLVREEAESQIAEGAKESKRKLARDKKRVAELDKLIKQIYEDKTNGSLSVKRYEVLSRDYEAEQEQLEADIEEAEARLATLAKDTDNAEKFIAIVRKYTDFSELTAAMLNEYVAKITVFEAEKINHRRKQRVEVHLNFIGQFNPPIEGEPIEEEPFDPIAHRREIGRNSYYKRRDQILAKEAAKRAEAKAAKLAAAQRKSRTRKRRGVNITANISGTISASGTKRNAPRKTPDKAWQQPPPSQRRDNRIDQPPKGGLR